MLKIGRDLKAIAFANKIINLGQNVKMPKKCEKRLYEHFRVVGCKKPLEKTLNIRKMREF